MDEDEVLPLVLYEIGALKFGEYETKAGLKTETYFDLTALASYPKAMAYLVKKITYSIQQNCPHVVNICGIPYTTLPLTTLTSLYCKKPMLITKTCGTEDIIQGKFNPGDTCLIIEDVLTSGNSIIETAYMLRREGLTVTDAFVIIDGQEGGERHLSEHGIRMTNLYRLSELMRYFPKNLKMWRDVFGDAFGRIIRDYYTRPVKVRRLKNPFHVRASKCKNEIGSKLFNLMESKQSTICLAADLTKADAVIELADLVGPHIVLLKTHVDILEDFNDNFVKRLKELAKKHDFLLMEDRKFADISNTACLQCEKGIYKIAQWADVVTVHAIAGQSIIDGFKNSLKNISEPRGLFIVAEMSSKGALTTIDEYVRNAVSVAESSDMVVGVVSQSNVVMSLGLIQLTPAVRIYKRSDDFEQEYKTPESAVNSGADLAVVGRGITEAKNKLAATLRYKKALWNAYMRRIKIQ